jgi:hypothetical protein
MTAPLTPESEALLARLFGDPWIAADLAAIEAAAIARYAEGLVEAVARNLWRADEAMVTGDYAAHEAEARRLIAIPEAQEER